MSIIYIYFVSRAVEDRQTQVSINAIRPLLSHMNIETYKYIVNDTRLSNLHYTKLVDYWDSLRIT